VPTDRVVGVACRTVFGLGHGAVHDAARIAEDNGWFT
jgi:hypothetical protein